MMLQSRAVRVQLLSGTHESVAMAHRLVGAGQLVESVSKRDNNFSSPDSILDIASGFRSEFLVDLLNGLFCTRFDLGNSRPEQGICNSGRLLSNLVRLSQLLFSPKTARGE